MPFMRPGQEFKQFTILQKKTTRSAAGSIGRKTDFEVVGELCGVPASTSPKEREFYKQNNIDVSNKIIQYYGQIAKKGQYLQRTTVTEEVETYYIEAIKNPAGLDHFTVYYVNKRDDLKYETVNGTGSGENKD